MTHWHQTHPYKAYKTLTNHRASQPNNMTTKGEQPPTYYSPLPPQPNSNNHQEHRDQYYIVLPLYNPPNRFQPCCSFRRFFLCSASLILLSLAIFLLWPSDPDLNIVRVHLNNVQLRVLPTPSLDISMALTIKVRNKDFFSLDYRSLMVSIGYRGRELGFVNSTGGKLRARGSSYINATLELDGIEILHDAIYLLEDLIKGSIPFDTVTEIRGKVGFLFYEIPLKAKVSCEVYVNIDNQTIIRQDCYPE